MKKTLLKLVSLSLLLTFILGIIALLYYPNQDRIAIATATYAPGKITERATTSALISFSPRSARANLAAAEATDQVSNIEQVSPEALAQFQNSGNIVRSVETLDTHLTIPTGDISGALFDGEDAFTMEKGLWHFPLSVGPGDKGNFIVIGHRFDKVPPATDTFYNLDKVRVGDKIEISQDGGIEYTYTVVDTRIVEKGDRTVLAPTDDYQITLITCAPLWTSDQRLVVTGILDKVYRTL